MIPKNLLPLHAEWCIAGGWAACPPLATDRDVWVYDKPTETLKEARLALLQHLTGAGFQFTASSDVRRAPGYAVAGISILKVADIYIRGQQPIHLIVTDAENPDEILAGFDVSTHQVAMLPNGHLLRGQRFTPVNLPPKRLLDSTQTPARMQKIAARYGHTPKESTVGETISV